MEHGQQADESIGAMLSSIAAVLREVSDKLDAVAARVDGAVPIPPAEHGIESRLAKLEAWAFRAGQDISGIDGRLEKVEAGAGAEPAAPAAARPPLPRATRRNAAASEPAAHEPDPAAQAPAVREGGSRRYEGGAGSENGTARDSAAHELNAVPQRSFSAPREPVTPEQHSPSGFTAPTPREPVTASREPITASREPIQAAREQITTPREPVAVPREPTPAAQEFTAPTPREPLPSRQSSFTAPRESIGSPYQNFTSPQEKPYESMVPSAHDSGDYGAGRTNGAAPEENGVALTGAHRASDESLIPVDNTHVDKLQAMLDELKKTAAAPLGRNDIFGPPATDLSSTGYQPERSTDTPRDYRLSSPPSS
ncbi:hypothetical protein [Nocardia brasiliensis]|uniref:hypothetical protein n=1 Tax=Nocardia brasiliensis TaxID=37326 RepID=UPI002454FF20|nr:hypothetical protein [Nocardia brasiliensis]